MGYNSDELPLASDFQPLEGEANFGPPLTREVVGGAHIAPHCISVEDGQFILVDWAEGLPRHDAPGTRAIRFPHGLIIFGESFEECASRLVADQLGMETARARVIHVYSYVDEANHWHMEPLILTYVTGQPAPPQGASVVRSEIGPELPEGAGWRGKPPFEEAFEQFIGPQLSIVETTIAQ
jgi:ADP-ribose pyrophosphatase YjhB (NUDIX family)